MISRYFLGVLYGLFLILVLTPFQSSHARQDTNVQCQTGMCDEETNGGGGGGGGGGSPLTVHLKNDALDRELAPWSCSLETARISLTNYLESIEGTPDSLNLEPLTTSEVGDTIETAAYLESKSELQTPWSGQIKSFHFVYKQYAEIPGVDPIIVDQSHISFLVKCDTVTGDTRLTSLRGKYFGSMALRGEYIIKFDSGFNRLAAFALAVSQLESCESVIDTPRFFAIPGTTRLVEALELITTTDGEICGSPPIPYGRSIVVTAQQNIYIYDDTSGLGSDITGQVSAYVMGGGPFTGDEGNLVEVPLAELEVEAYNGSTCFEDTTGINGDYSISSATGSLSCIYRLPREYQTNSCGLPRGNMIQIKDALGSILNESISCSSGSTIDYTFNAPGSDRERYTPQTNVYYHTEKAHKWLFDLLSPADQTTLNSQTVKAYVNTDDGDCQAEHQFGARTMHFSQQGAKCYNMAFDSPIYHEYGHFVDNIFGQVERSNNVELAMSEGWGDVFSSYMTENPYIGYGMYKDSQTDGYVLRNLYDPVKWIDPACLNTVNPGSVCGPSNNEDCECNPDEDAAAQACTDLSTTEEILECRRYHYGQVWASMIFKLRERIAGENAGDPDYVNRLVVSALTADVQSIEDGLSKILNSDIPSSRIIGTEPPHLCTVQGVAREYGFNLELIPELDNFDDCFLKTYPEDSTPGNHSMFNSLMRDSEDNFYVSGYSNNDLTTRQYYHKKIDEFGNVLGSWSTSVYPSVFTGYDDRGKAAIEVGGEYYVLGRAGSVYNNPGANFWLGKVNKNNGSLNAEYGPFGTPPSGGVDGPLLPQWLDMAQSIQPIDGGTNGYVIAGLTQTQTSGNQNCTPPIDPNYQGSTPWPGEPGGPPAIPCADAFIGYLDSNLNPEFTSTTGLYTFSSASGYSDVFHEARQISSGELLIAGMVKNSSRDAVLLKVGARQPLSSATWYTNFSTDDQVFRDFIEVKYSGSPDGFLVVGYTQGADKNEALLIRRLSNDFTPGWEGIYDTPSSINREKATSVRQYADESGFLVAGISSSALGGETGKTVLMKLDNNGNQIWCKKYPHFYTDIQGPNLALTSDGTGFLITGQYYEEDIGLSAAVMRITLDGDAPTTIKSCGYDTPPAARNNPRQPGRMTRGF